MIQRIQSVYLFFVFCLMAAIVFFPIYSNLHWLVSGITGIVALLAIVAIFLYKNRGMQIRISYIMLLLLISIYCFSFVDWQYWSITNFYQHARFTFVFPFIAIILLFLAIRAIKKDEKLVRSLDRLR